MQPEPTSPRTRSTPPPRAVLFDAFGTLFDVYSVSTLAEQLFPGQGERLSILWRDKQIDYTRLVSMSGAQGEHYRPFWELTRAALRYAALAPGPGAGRRCRRPADEPVPPSQQLSGEQGGAAGAEARVASRPAS